MTEVTKYIADDGTEFDDEWDCRQYEWTQTIGEPTFFLLGSELNLLDVKNANSYDDAWYIYIPTFDALRQLKKVWGEGFIDTLSPWFIWKDEDEIDLGLWAYDDSIHNDGWYHLGKYIEEKTMLANECLSKINGGV